MSPPEILSQLTAIANEEEMHAQMTAFEKKMARIEKALERNRTTHAKTDAEHRFVWRLENAILCCTHGADPQVVLDDVRDQFAPDVLLNHNVPVGGSLPNLLRLFLTAHGFEVGVGSCRPIV
jgi:hypothetical protein